MCLQLMQVINKWYNQNKWSTKKQEQWNRLYIWNLRNDVKKNLTKQAENHKSFISFTTVGRKDLRHSSVEHFWHPESVPQHILSTLKTTKERNNLQTEVWLELFFGFLTYFGNKLSYLKTWHWALRTCIGVCGYFS